MGFRRKKNDALLMFCLRHYGQNANGKRMTINYFSTRASAGAASGEQAQIGAEAATTTVRTVIAGPSGARPSTGSGLSEAAALLSGFEGVGLDSEAQAAIAAALEGCAARSRAAEAAYEKGGEAAADAAEDDPGESFVRLGELGDPYRGELVPAVAVDEFVPFAPGEPHWSLAGAEMPPERLMIEDQPAEKSAEGETAGGSGMAARKRRKAKGETEIRPGPPSSGSRPIPPRAPGSPTGATGGPAPFRRALARP